MRLLFALLLLCQGTLAQIQPPACGADVEREAPEPKGSIAERVGRMFERAANFTRADKVRDELELVLQIFEAAEAIGGGRTDRDLRLFVVKSKLVTESQARELETRTTPFRLTSGQIQVLKVLCEKDDELYPVTAQLLLTGGIPSEESVGLLQLALTLSSLELGRAHNQMPRYPEFRAFSNTVETLINDNRRELRARRGVTGDVTPEEEEEDWELGVERGFNRAMEERKKK